MKEYRKDLIVASIVILLPIIVGLLFWDKLPDKMATHFGSDGVANGWSSKEFTVFGLPVLLAALEWITCAATLADPKKQNISKKVFKIIIWCIPLVSWVCAGASYAYSLDIKINVAFFVNFIVAAIFIVIGNYLPKCKQSYTVGIKTPWALNDEQNWNKTHRLGGWIWTVGGIVCFANIFINSQIVMLVAIGVMVVIPYLYSFLLYKRQS